MFVYVFLYIYIFMIIPISVSFPKYQSYLDISMSRHHLIFAHHQSKQGTCSGSMKIRTPPALRSPNAQIRAPKGSCKWHQPWTGI